MDLGFFIAKLTDQNKDAVVARILAAEHYLQRY